MPVLFAILFLAAPLYVWRFSLGGLPTNFLMLLSIAVIVAAKFKVWRDHGYSMQETWRSYFRDIRGMDRMLLIGIILVSVASVIALFSFGLDSAKLGQWIVLYFEPIAIFFLLRHYAVRQKDDERLVLYISWAAYALLAASGILALIQYHTLATLPTDWWGNANEPKRAIAFFAHPNAYALFVTPLLAWLIPDLASRFRSLLQTAKQLGVSKLYSKDGDWRNLALVAAWLVGALGMFLTLSRGAWMGLLAAAALYVLLSANRRLFVWALGGLVALVIIVAAVPNLRYRAILPFYGEKSAAARISLWHTGSKMIQDSPFLGKGINGFDYNWSKYNTDSNLNHYNFPHNILLNFWIDLGFLGMVGMIMIFISGLLYGLKNRRYPLPLGLLLFLAAIIVHGLIDIPYLKNDLALVFWMILAISM